MWATDITRLPMARGFVYLCAIMDWASRKLLAWRVSATLTPDFCVAALETVSAVRAELKRYFTGFNHR